MAANFQADLGTISLAQTVAGSVCVTDSSIQLVSNLIQLALGLGLTQPGSDNLSDACEEHVLSLTHAVHGQGLSSPTDQPVHAQSEPVSPVLNQCTAKATAKDFAPAVEAVIISGHCSVNPSASQVSLIGISLAHETPIQTSTEPNLSLPLSG